LFYAIAFFQIFNGLPLFYKDVYQKSEAGIGLLLGLNGLIVFAFEVVIVYNIEKKYQASSLIIIGSVMLGVSFLLFNFIHAGIILIIAMVLLSFSEIFAMPFMISHAVNSSQPGTRGSYIAAYTIAWSLALILSPYVSAHIIGTYGFTELWWVIGGICTAAALGFMLVMRRPAKSTATAK
jgi:predicted MFS family arabinose efflux permease